MMTIDPPIIDQPGEGYALALHGGAGTLDESSLNEAERNALHEALRQALQAGEAILEAGGPALDAVEAVVIALENSPHFHAGHGACMTWAGDHELDAAIMAGEDLRCGAVAGTRHIRNPINAARAVMERSEHVLLSGSGADQFARHCGLSLVDNDYFTTPMRQKHWEQLHDERAASESHERDLFQFGTVGAVARDRNGHLAAATSTGGITNKRWGRVGDSPLFGAGTLADDRSCAISCTGRGELFIRHGVAHEISARMRLAGQSAADTITSLLSGPLAAPGGTGGIIAVDRDGRIVLDFNTRGMYRAWRTEQGASHTAIEQSVITYE